MTHASTGTIMQWEFSAEFLNSGKSLVTIKAQSQLLVCCVLCICTQNEIALDKRMDIY